LRVTGDYSDLRIVCGDLEFKVHRCVVCLRSSYFELACRENRWKVSLLGLVFGSSTVQPADSHQEGTEGVIELKSNATSATKGEEEEDEEAEEEDFSCDDPGAVRHMIDYMYLLDYTVAGDVHRSRSTKQASDNTSLSGAWRPKQRKILPIRRSQSPASVATEAPPGPDEHSPGKPEINIHSPAPMDKILTMHARLYGLGAKYHLRPLQNLALQKFKAAAQLSRTNEDMASAILVTFNSTPESDRRLRDALIEEMVKYAHDMTQDLGVETAIKSVDGLAFALFKAQSQQTGARTPAKPSVLIETNFGVFD
jgi:hypothetical protein